MKGSAVRARNPSRRQAGRAPASVRPASTAAIRVRIGFIQARTDALAGMMFGVGDQQTEGAEHARQRRNDHPSDTQFRGDAGGEQRSVAAERQQRELPRIAAAFHRHRADRPHHRRRGQPQHAERRFFDGAVQAVPPDRARSPLARHRRSSFSAPADQPAGIEIPQHQIAVRDGRRGAAAAVTNRARIGAGALRADLRRAAGVQPADRAAAGADLGQIDRRQFQHVAGADQQPRSGHHAAADLDRLGAQDLAVLDQAGLGGGAAHVEGDDPRLVQPPRQRRTADDARGGAAFDDVRRRRGGERGRGQAAVRLHQLQRRIDPQARAAGHPAR